MPSYSGQQAASQYRKLGLQGEIQSASAHRLIQMLFEGALEQLNKAHFALEQGDLAGKGHHIGRAIDIVSGLRQSLDIDSGDLAAQLDSLYQYCEFTLLEASRHNNLSQLQEVARLLTTLKSGWDGIAPEAKA